MIKVNVNEVAESINTIAKFCGLRDIDVLSQSNLQSKYGFQRADVLILFGGSIPYGCDIAAQAILNGVANHFMIVGGVGHTTESLRQKLKQSYPQIETDGRTESEIMAEYIKIRYKIEPDWLECESTNCGNNVTNALAILKQNHIPHDSIIVIQDSTMQRRMVAGFKKHCNSKIISYAAYTNPVVVNSNCLAFEHDDIWGMWDIEHYITLLMGEIPRLTDNADGYGPNGKQFIAHVDIPQEVCKAFDALQTQYVDSIRIANPKYATNSSAVDSKEISNRDDLENQLLIHKAIEFATLAHDGQKRKGSNVPYIVHPFEVAQILTLQGASEQVIVAGLLHDTIEDTHVTIEEIQTLFGKEIAHLVAGNSENKTLPWEERKQHTINYMKENATFEEMMICCADKLSNLRSLKSDYMILGEGLWKRFHRGKEHQKWYYDSLLNALSSLCDYSMYEEYITIFHNVFDE
ncbi:HD domain-containing protein [Paludicola sp. MB14-C6]|uniref:YdcF family protein n=1 Tax=Paludihabitans sp. MB14-C6 TaxID=3070656 RepID=UPI0027DB2B79|nr:HD domain-containing protein [Paludicola sp. MB14-C6]WMJ23965.1 HD domain-containing protein [Paludicola sp. MB14-C6]